jgi:hypothetical protein
MSISMVLGHYITFTIFLTPFGSQYRQPLAHKQL